MSADIPGYYLATKKDHRPSVVEYVNDGKVPAHWLNVSDSRLASCPRTYGYDLVPIGDCAPVVAAPVQVVVSDAAVSAVVKAVLDGVRAVEGGESGVRRAVWAGARCDCGGVGAAVKSLATFVLQCAAFATLCTAVVVVLWTPIIVFLIIWSLK